MFPDIGKKMAIFGGLVKITAAFGGLVEWLLEVITGQIYIKNYEKEINRQLNFQIQNNCITANGGVFE